MFRFQSTLGNLRRTFQHDYLYNTLILFYGFYRKTSRFMELPWSSNIFQENKWNNAKNNADSTVKVSGITPVLFKCS